MEYYIVIGIIEKLTELISYITKASQEKFPSRH